MPLIGDRFTTKLKKAHLRWGIHRYTATRDAIYGEGYLQIPAHIARHLNIKNSNDGSISPLYKCNSNDGFLKDKTLLASGSSKKGYKFAKQFQGKGDLKLLGNWFTHINAKEGDLVEIKFIAKDEILITKL